MLAAILQVSQWANKTLYSVWHYKWVSDGFVLPEEMNWLTEASACCPANAKYSRKLGGRGGIAEDKGNVKRARMSVELLKQTCF